MLESVVFAAVYETEGREWMTCYSTDWNACNVMRLEDERDAGPAWSALNVFKRVVRVKCEEVPDAL